MKYFCSAIWNPNSTPVLFGIFSKFIALFSRAIWDEELYKEPKKNISSSFSHFILSQNQELQQTTYMKLDKTK